MVDCASIVSFDMYFKLAQCSIHKFQICMCSACRTPYNILYICNMYVYHNPLRTFYDDRRKFRTVQLLNYICLVVCSETKKEKTKEKKKKNDTITNQTLTTTKKERKMCRWSVD